MSEILLSIVVPTKNRTEYLKSFIDLYSSFDRFNTELVVQDNSDSDAGISQYIEKYPDLNIVYDYVQKPMPVIENSELAILHSRGKYVCFMGDDDLLSKHIVKLVEKMDEANIDSISFKKAIFNWPGMQYRVHSFPSLIIPRFSGKIRHINPNKEYKKLLDRGATELGDIPQLYHGVVRRSVLDRIRDDTGTFFPGPSPDMAIATCLSRYVVNHVYLEAPFISSGKSPKSAAGLGAKHEHKGNLNTISFLPPDIEKKWDKRLPFIWTGPTIYAQSAIEAIMSMGLGRDLGSFNFSYFYAYFDTFHSDYREIAKESRDNVRIDTVKYLTGRITVFMKRFRAFVKNKSLLSLHIGGKLVDNIPNCIEAEKIIDQEIEKTLDIRTLKFR